METKKCGKCKEVKIVDDFYKNPAKKDGLATMCKSCQSKYQKQWYIRNRKKHQENAGKNHKKRQEERTKFVYEYLKFHPCVDCGETDPVVLHFDHVRGKKSANVSRLKTNSLDVMLREIDKCEVRCANCHLRITAKRGGFLMYKMKS